MAAATVKRRPVSEILDVEARDAWGEYLSLTQGVLEPRYAEIEPWAWQRLQVKLTAIGARRRAAAARGRGLAA